MSYWVSMFFFVPMFLFGDSSLTISSVRDAAPRLQEGTPSPDCPSCSLSQVKKNSSWSGGQSDMVEAVKRHILNMLHMSARPNLTQPVPRAALLNAIKKLHVGHVGQDGSVEIQEESSSLRDSTLSEPPSEVIIFGEPGESRAGTKVIFGFGFITLFKPSPTSWRAQDVNSICFESLRIEELLVRTSGEVMCYHHCFAHPTHNKLCLLHLIHHIHDTNKWSS